MTFFENDADYEMAELERQGNRVSELRKQGICLHGWIQETDAVITCLHCNKVVTRAEIDELYTTYM